MSREFYRLDELADGLRSGCGAFSGDEVFVCVHVLRFVLKERDCSLHPPRESRTAPDKTHPSVSAPLTAEQQQHSDSGRKDVSPVGTKLREAPPNGADTDGMNTDEVLVNG